MIKATVNYQSKKIHLSAFFVRSKVPSTRLPSHIDTASMEKSKYPVSWILIVVWQKSRTSDKEFRMRGLKSTDHSTTVITKKRKKIQWIG